MDPRAAFQTKVKLSEETAYPWWQEVRVIEAWLRFLGHQGKTVN